ncbi:MAG: hypothetical protein FWG34_14665 [Oscillospiraceae bacterium]|nr:hypothetical protein [Oscillospiraceae bacterium]
MITGSMLAGFSKPVILLQKQNIQMKNNHYDNGIKTEYNPGVDKIDENGSVGEQCNIVDCAYTQL